MYELLGFSIKKIMKLGSLPICLKVHLYIVVGGFKCSFSSLLIFWEKADGVNDPVHSLIGLINSLSFKSVSERI